MSLSTGLLTAYTTRHPSISNSFICPYLQVYLRTIPPHTPALEEALYVVVYRFTYMLHRQTIYY